MLPRTPPKPPPDDNKKDEPGAIPKVKKFEPPTGRLSAVTRKGNEILSFIDNQRSDVCALKDLLGQYEDKITNLKIACDQPMINSNDETLTDWWNEHNAKIVSTKITADKYLKEITDKNDVSSMYSMSVKSNTSSARVRLAERKAQIEAEKVYSDRMLILEKQELENKQKFRDAQVEKLEVERIVLERELDKLDNIAINIENPSLKYFETPKQKFDDPNVNKANMFDIDRDTNAPYLNPMRNRPHEVNSGDLLDVLNRQNEISMNIARHQQMTELPKKELTIFDGNDVVGYRNFMLNFMRTIGNKCDDEADKLYFLQQYTAGIPNALVKSCSQRDASRAYHQALMLLEEEYGNEHKTASTILEKLEKWPNIKSEDGESLKNFSIFLISCQNSMEDMSSLNQLNSPKEIMSIVLKLPYELRKKWRDRTQSLNDLDIAVTFAELVLFVRKQTKIINQPIFGSIKDDVGKTSYSSETRRKLLVTRVDDEEHESDFCDSTLSMNERKICAYCKKKNHEISFCQFFKRIDYDKRVEFIKAHNLCFACLNEGHSSRGCYQRSTCNICHKKHPSLLHIFPERFEGASEFHTQDSARNTKSCTVKVPCSDTGVGVARKVLCATVPIRIKAPGKDEYIEIYAALDTCSSACFMDNRLLKKLGITGKSSLINISTMENSGTIETRVVNNLQLYDLNNEKRGLLPVVYAQNKWPFTKEDTPNKSEMSDLNVPFTFIDADIGLIIGMNCPEIIKPLQIITTENCEVYATLHQLGWALNGPVKSDKDKIMVNRIKSSDISDIERKVNEMYSRDYADSHIMKKEMSQDDLKWKEIMVRTIKLTNDKHYEINLPLKSDMPLDNNRSQAFHAFQSLLKKFSKNLDLSCDYNNFITMMKRKGFMEEISENELSKTKCWYLTHHAVYHKEKNKIRVVFNCSLKYNGISLNDILYQGPDLTNSLLGVILRFRQNKVAFIGDIEKMFYQVRVSPECRDYLRFFWYEDTDTGRQIREYRLTVHVFGATSSPSVANFALRQTTVDNDNYSEEAKSIVNRNFYVDDLLYSSPSVDVASELLLEVRNLVLNGGFRITDFLTNSYELSNRIKISGLSCDLKSKDISETNTNRALGLIWDVETDSLSPKFDIQIKPVTKRGILSVIHSLYDPLGLTSPVLIEAKKIFQDSCQQKIDWDCGLPLDLKIRWDKWYSELPLIKEFKVERCCMPFEAHRVELHYFCDGSTIAYGAIAYVRFVSNDAIHCSPLLSKVRLNPLSKSVHKTIPRIELNGAKLSILLHQILEEELDYNISARYFWTDSTAVLKYINCEDKCFARFVANRVTFIRGNSDKNEWRYIPSNINPADYVSRGVPVGDFLKLKTWHRGPDFLWDVEENWPNQDNVIGTAYDELEVKKPKKCLTTKLDEIVPTESLLQCSSWYRAKVRVAWMLRFKEYLQKKTVATGTLSAHELLKSENALVKYIQIKHFHEEYRVMWKGGNLTKNSPLLKLNPYLDCNGILRVGGRLQNSHLGSKAIHPIILPAKNTLVMYLIEGTHKMLGHMGRETVVAHLRKMFWILGLSGIIKRVLFNCAVCRKLNAQPYNQKMAALPVDRLEGNEPAFTRTGLDYFGPFEVTNGRKHEKRYGVVFSCLNSRAIHLEMAGSLSTDSFVNALRRFVARRGNVKFIRSDNGTNLTSGCRELKQAINEWNSNHIETWLKQRGIEWKFQPPTASHFGGVFEREIRSVRKVLNSILMEQPIKLSDERLNTLLCEVESILNCRPLTDLSYSGDDFEALTPNHLLLLHAGATFPPGLFSKQDSYCNKRWKQVQYLADLFWTRWNREYVPLLQKRQKWFKENYTYQVGDLVLLTDQCLPRNQWSLGRISEVYPSTDGTVRVVKVRVVKCKENKSFTTTELRRPVTKLILICSV